MRACVVRCSFGTDYAEVNLKRIQYWIDSGRLDASKPITMRVLMESGLVKSSRIVHGIKLLSTGADELRSPVTIELSDASKAAVDAVARVGGRVVKVYFTRVGLRAHLTPRKFVDRLYPRFAAVPPDVAAKGVLHPDDAPSAQYEQSTQKKSNA